MEMQPTGQRIAQRPQRMQMASSLIITEPTVVSLSPSMMISYSLPTSAASEPSASTRSSVTRSMQLSGQIS